MKNMTGDSGDAADTMTAGAHVSGPGARWWPWLGLAAALVVVFALWVWNSGKAGQAVQYKTAEVQRGDLVVQVTATGNLQPTNKLLVGIEVSGTIKTVEAEHNDVVKAGQVLARLDTAKLEAQMQQSQALLESAQAKLRQTEVAVAEADQEMKRMVKLRRDSNGRLPSAHDFDTAEAALKRAEADKAVSEASIAEARAKLLITKTDLGKANIRSPINGVVLERSVEPGQTVAASFQAPELFTLAEDLTKMELQVNVDEADVGQVQAGQTAVFAVDAYPDRTFPARISQVRYGAQTTSGVVTYLTILEVDNSDLVLRPGMTATADIEVKRVDNALLVPSAALRYSPAATDAGKSGASGGSLVSKLMPRPSMGRKPVPAKKAPLKGPQQVWVLREGVPAAIAVTTGATSGAMTEIVEGELSPGTPVIVESVGNKEK